ncbi:hypothetical protein FB45DRAFT_274236 [Roridomyces roridus]|uniref:F-box domain-containing protein n=1 Tax=Roridomyces roridus TaxID=1738132 RepID=A0AAD7FE30_9AGAR|nr:hypothetical protein FB45DRAFT_274236 [Roridomyces roridus]
MSSSVPALRGRGDDDNEMAAVNEADVHRDLEDQSSDAQLDRVASLPLELSSDIFTQALPKSPDMRASCTLLIVCHAWNEIALAMPSLWNTITDAGIPPMKFPTVLRLWLGRGDSYPLSLSIRQDMGWASLAMMANALRKHAPRLQSLDMLFVYLERGTTFPQFDALQSLTLRGEKDRIVSLTTSLDMLHLAPNLVECNFVDVNYADGEDVQPWTSSSLRHLRLDTGVGDEFRNPISSHILRHLTLPSLRTLRMRERNDQGMLIDFLTRSLPPLRTLQFRSPVLTHTVVEIARMCPFLEELHVTLFGRVSDMFEVLATNPDILPELRSITICDVVQLRNVYEHVLDFLRNRAIAKTLRIIVEELGSLNEDRFCDRAIYTQFRKFHAAGINIHIGLPGINFFSMELDELEARETVEDYRRRLLQH